MRSYEEMMKTKPFDSTEAYLKRKVDDYLEELDTRIQLFLESRVVLGVGFVNEYYRFKINPIYSKAVAESLKSLGYTAEVDGRDQDQIWIHLPYKKENE